MLINALCSGKPLKLAIVSLIAVAAVASSLLVTGSSVARAASFSGHSYSVLGDSSHDPISRGELAKRVANAAGFHEDAGPQLFQDVPPGSTYYRYVNRLANRGIVTGFPCGTRVEEPC